MDQNIQNSVWINNLKTAWPILIDGNFEFLGQFTVRCTYIIFQKGVDNFEIEHKKC